MLDILLDLDEKNFKYEFELKKEPCFCGKGYIYKVSRYGLNRIGNKYYFDNFEEIKKITCEFCKDNYNNLKLVIGTLDNIIKLEERLYDYKFDNEYISHNLELIEMKKKKIQEYNTVKTKLEKYKIIDLPSVHFNKHKWAEYFVKNNLTKFNEEECYKKVFYGSDKIGLDIFLKTVGIKMEEYNIILRNKHLSLKDDRIHRIEEEILDNKYLLLQNYEFVEILLENKKEIKFNGYRKILEQLAGEYEEIKKMKQLNMDMIDIGDVSDESYSKEDVAFYIEDALTYFFYKFSDDKRLMPNTIDDKKSFINEYICDTLGEEYIEKYYEDEYDDWDEYDEVEDE